MATYATVTDLETYIGEPPPPESDRLLARAQDLIDAVLIASIYTVDSNGNATDATVIAGLKTATCAQVESWLASGDELNSQGQWSAFSIEGVAVSRWSSEGSRRYRLCDRAWDALQAAGLVPGKVITPR